MLKTYVLQAKQVGMAASGIQELRHIKQNFAPFLDVLAARKKVQVTIHR